MKWLGMTAVYTPVERQIMSALPVPEQRLLHVLKAFMDGEVSESVDSVKPPVSETDSVIQAKAPKPFEPLVGDGGRGGSSPQGGYINPEDIPFGEPKKRTRPVYALVWTHRKHRVYKTKAKAQVKLKAWKRWYERQGWKVSSHSTGYFAAKGIERHAISLHEYDAETKERLK